MEKKIFSIGKKSQWNSSNKNIIPIQVDENFQLKYIQKSHHMNLSS